MKPNSIGPGARERRGPGGTDRALEELDEPTLVIFFGDHQPELGSDFSQAVLDESDPFAQYTTPYLIWANYPLEEDQLPENGSVSGSPP